MVVVKTAESVQKLDCPQGMFGLRSEQALRPFGACAECTHMSHMSCKAEKNAKLFEINKIL
ncbi:MAG: hypothetical protein FWE33_02280 [Defluviitaleaceae bacterium]|nr:hypothetical protein [Defluviitaleaceae bacterium]